ncbi:MAG: hypothetical protein AB9873_13265 [Syntrophobacteraceae bacterium]
MSRIYIVNIARPKSIKVVTYIDIPMIVDDIYISNSTVYMACHDSYFKCIKIMDISRMTSPKVIASLEMLNSAISVAVSGSYAYVAGDDGLTVVDINAPQYPAIVAETGGPIFKKIVISGSLAYLSGLGDQWEPIFQIVNISNPLDPILLGRMEIPDRLASFAISGDYAYFTSYPGVPADMQVVDMRDRHNPSISGSIDILSGDSGGCFAINSSATCLYVASPNDGLYMLDASSPKYPLLINSLPVNTSMMDTVAVSGSYAYLISENFSNGQFTGFDVSVYDISTCSPCAAVRRGNGWVITIDGMDFATTFVPGWPDMPTMYLYEAIPQKARETITKNVGIIVPFPWSRDTVDTADAVDKLHELIKRLTVNNEPIVVLAHSWGTVISYIAAQLHEDIYIDKLITLGSPLGSRIPGCYLYTASMLEAFDITSVARSDNIREWHHYWVDCDRISGEIYSLSPNNNFPNNRKFAFSPCHSSYFNDKSLWKRILRDVSIR